MPLVSLADTISWTATKADILANFDTCLLLSRFCPDQVPGVHFLAHSIISKMNVSPTESSSLHFEYFTNADSLGKSKVSFWALRLSSAQLLKAPHPL